HPSAAPSGPRDRLHWLAMAEHPTPPPPTPDPPDAGPAAHDLVLARALQAVGRARALGLHFYGHFVGIGGTQAVGGRSEVWIEGEPEGSGATGVSTVALATVADLAIGAAIRSHLEAGCRLGTVTLSVQHPRGAIDGAIVVRGQ